MVPHQPRRSLKCSLLSQHSSSGSLIIFLFVRSSRTLLPLLSFPLVSYHLSKKGNMAAASNSAPLDPKLGRAADFVRPDFHQVNLDLENYLKTERNFKLDAGMSLTTLYIFYADILYRPTNMSSVHHASGLSASAFTMSLSSHYPLPTQFQATTSSPGSPSRARKEANGLQTLPSKPL